MAPCSLARFLAALALAATAAGQAVSHYEWHVTLGYGAPDCFAKPVMLVNGSYNPVLEVRQGDILELNLYNDLPASFLDTAGGISFHWHGWSMRHNEWYDGTPYESACPIAPGTNFTYRFQVNEAVGSYLWHDHSQAYRTDGLQGPLIVRPPAGGSEGFTYDAEFPMFIADVFHGLGDALTESLQRPDDPALETPVVKSWEWVGLPQAFMVNGHGFYGDCLLYGGLNGGVANSPSTCNVSTYTVQPGRSLQQPWASSDNPGCSHSNFTVEQGKTYRFRIISGAVLAYSTVCFEGHNVTIIAADATPVQPTSFGNCVDINSGQRYDVLLTANQPVGNYWISVQEQYRVGAPNGYAILHYAGAPNATLPATVPSQPGSVQPWTLEQVNSLATHPALVDTATASPADAALISNQIYPGNSSSLQVPETANVQVEIGLTQPLIMPTGQLRWALNNVVQPATPPCRSILQEVYDNPDWAYQNAVQPGFYGDPYYNNGSEFSNGTTPAVFMAQSPAPTFPSEGLHILQVNLGDVVDLIIQDLAANANNGDYLPADVNRTAQEEHPFHLHGHHFFLLATGNGTFDAATSPGSYNLQNPVFRDTVTIPQKGWAAYRFVADNPGVWLNHCHLDWHLSMGQAMYVVTEPSLVSAPPANLPPCQRVCELEQAVPTVADVAQQYGSTGFETADELTVG